MTQGGERWLVRVKYHWPSSGARAGNLLPVQGWDACWRQGIPELAPREFVLVFRPACVFGRLGYRGLQVVLYLKVSLSCV